MMSVVSTDTAARIGLDTCSARRWSIVPVALYDAGAKLFAALLSILTAEFLPIYV